MSRVTADEFEAVNLVTVRRLFLELFGKGRVDIADQLMTDDYVNHDPSPGAGSTRQDVQEVAARLHEMWPTGVDARIDRMAVDGDLVAVQGTLAGGDGSGTLTELRMSEFFRCRDGLISERWGVSERRTIKTEDQP